MSGNNSHNNHVAQTYPIADKVPYGTYRTVRPYQLKTNLPFQRVLLFVIVAESTSVEAIAARSLKENAFKIR